MCACVYVYVWCVYPDVVVFSEWHGCSVSTLMTITIDWQPLVVKMALWVFQWSTLRKEVRSSLIIDSILNYDPRYSPCSHYHLCTVWGDQTNDAWQKPPIPKFFPLCAIRWFQSLVIFLWYWLFDCWNDLGMTLECVSLLSVIFLTKLWLWTLDWLYI